jgi:hypothetical protein
MAHFQTPASSAPAAQLAYTYVTTKHFLSVFGIGTLRDLPDVEALEDAGLSGRKTMATGSLYSPPDDVVEEVILAQPLTLLIKHAQISSSES